MPNKRAASQPLHCAVLAASERGQREIAESLHGTLCQTLGGAGLMAKVLAARMKAGQPVDSSELESLAETLYHALDEARHVLTQLQPVAPGRDGLMTALSRLAAETSVEQTLCAFECESAVFVEDPDAALSFYRVAEEAIKNALHAEARQITISLRKEDEAITLLVTDDGQTLPPPASEAQWRRVEMMRSRALAAGGKFTADVNSRFGMVVGFTLPQPVAA